MKRTFATLLLVLGALPLHAGVVYDLNSTVLDGGSSPNTFFVANGQASPAGLTYNSGTPSLTDTGGANGNFTYFVVNFSSFSLTTVGDSITLNYSFTPSSASAFTTLNVQNFRTGFFNSNGTPIAANSTSDGATALSNDTGYSASYAINNSPTASSSFYQRTGTNTNLWQSGTYTSLSGPTLSTPGTSSVTGSFTLTLVSTGVQITSILNGGAAQSVIDTTGLVTTFDSLSIFGITGSTNPTLTFNTLTVTTAAVPEPSTVALLGLVGLVAFGVRRHLSRFAA